MLLLFRGGEAMMIKSLNQWWLLKSFESKDALENVHVKDKLENQPLCRAMHIEQVNENESILIFEWYLKVNKFDWVRLERITGTIINTRKTGNLLYIETTDANYVFAELADE